MIRRVTSKTRRTFRFHCLDTCKTKMLLGVMQYSVSIGIVLKIPKKTFPYYFAQILYGELLGGIANNADPGQTALKSRLSWVCTVCICHFETKVGVRSFKTIAVHLICDIFITYLLSQKLIFSFRINVSIIFLS